MDADRQDARSAASPSPRERAGNFLLALAATITAIAFVVGWIYACIELGNPWGLVWAFGWIIIVFAWIVSGPQEEGGCASRSTILLPSHRKGCLQAAGCSGDDMRFLPRGLESVERRLAYPYDQEEPCLTSSGDSSADSCSVSASGSSGRSQHDRAAGSSSAASTLRELAEQARDDNPTWWLWDEPLIGDGKMLAFAHAATPEAVLALLDEIAELKRRLGYPEFAR